MGDVVMIYFKKNCGNLLFFIITICCFSFGSSIKQSITDSVLLHHHDNDYKMYLNESDNSYLNALIKNGVDSFDVQKRGTITYDHCTIIVKDTFTNIIAGATCDICRSPAIGEICEFNGIWVDEQYKNKQLETYIMNSLLDYITHKNCSIIQIEVHGIQNKSETKKFYETFGFITDATVPELENVETYIMRLPLHKRILVESPPILHTLELKTIRNKQSDIIEQKLNHHSHKNCSIISEQPYTIFITTIDEKIIAGVTGKIIEYAHLGKSCKTSAMWVDEKHRRHGLGTKIMDELTQYAKNNNCKNMHLETYEWQAKPFYEKCGFVTVATAPNVQKMRGLEQYYMRKDL